ncbi:MAG: transglutaminase-like domain-containing protein, partial [Myxococcota bacterium]
MAWRAQGIPPLDVEPSMPTAREVGTNLLVSTVPDWSTFLQWEKALMTGVFRTDPQLQELAQRIVGDAASPREKALRLHAWLMAQIRYQQDYEDHIAGVRPHPAPVVLERSYGDCKDKSVLFIAMARHVGLEARFALLRTRPKGPLLQEIPMQQFDHAIVYVPEQPGLERGFFVDSTADALDLEALRSDDVGTRALVFDPSVRSHEWRDIPFRGPEENGRSLALQLDIDASGGASGTVDLEGWGSTGSALRRLARNAQRLEQAAKGMTGRLLR